MLKIIQVSDLHLTPPGIRHLGCDPKARLQDAISSINREHADADLVIFTGDLTALGQTVAYSTLAACLQDLMVPYRLCLGNGDHRGRFVEVFGRSGLDEYGFVQTSVTLAGHRIICLDTLSSTGEHSGELCGLRLQWLESQLDAAGRDPILLFMHHPPFNVGMPFLDSLSLTDADALAERLTRHHIRHIFVGHLHRAIAGSWHGIPISVVRSTVSQFALRLGKPPARTLEAPFYAVALVSENDVIVHFHDYTYGGPIDDYTPVPEVIVDDETIAYQYQQRDGK